MTQLRKGFTLVEMLIVSLLLGLVFIAAFGLFGNVIRSQYSQIATSVLYNTATAVDSALANAAEGASWIELPGPCSVNPPCPFPFPNPGAAIRVWSGVNPADHSWLMVGIAPGFTHFCLDGGGHLWMYQSNASYNPGNPVTAPSITCGAAPPANVNQTELAGGAMSITASNLNVTQYSPNQLTVRYQLSMPANKRIQSASANTITHTTTLQAQVGGNVLP